MKSPFSRFPLFPFSPFLIFAVAAILFSSQPVSAQVVEIPDPNLRQAIREKLTLPDETPITQLVMNQLIELDAGSKQIEILTGLEYAANLKKLELSFNQIQDITPLAGLVNLELLALVENPIANLAPLANLTQLQSLFLAGVRISDLTPLSNLTELKGLQLGSCWINDIIPLSNLTQLDWLDLSRNQIVDISPLANLTQLKELRIDNNQVVDVSPLVNLTQLTNLTLANNAITDFRPLFGLNLQSVDIDIHKLQELASGEVEIPDLNLERTIRDQIGLPSETALTQLVMSQLIELEVGGKQIETLTGLEYAANLKKLELSFNQIQDITPLAGLVNLELLALVENPIADLSPLANLTQLQSLFLGGIRISDLTPLSSLTQLKELYLGSCWISDITPLSNLTQLSRLDLSRNQIVDISPLANLTQLEELRIETNWINDFSPIQGLSLTDLRYDEVCVLPDPPIQDRLENRSLPSIAQGWGNAIQNLPALSHEDRIAYHDIYWQHIPFELHFQPTPQGYQATGPLDHAKAKREELLAKNPNMLFLVEIRLQDAHMYTQYPEDWPYWLIDQNGDPVRASYREADQLYFIDFRLPGLQDIIVQQAISVARCGLYDGIMFDAWFEGEPMLTPLYGETLRFPTTAEEQLEVGLSIIQRIRANVPDDFLIMCKIADGASFHSRGPTSTAVSWKLPVTPTAITQTAGSPRLKMPSFGTKKTSENPKSTA